MSESALLSRCRAGDADAWDELFDQFYGVATRFVFQLSSDLTWEDAEEISQETFLSVIRNLGAFNGQSAFQTWLLRIAANKAHDHRQRAHAAKRGGGERPIPLSTGEADGLPPVDPPSPLPGPDALLASAETGALVRESLDQLDTACREIVELRYFADLSYEEIAASLRLNPKTVSSRLSRCLDRLEAVAREVFRREGCGGSRV